MGDTQHLADFVTALSLDDVPDPVASRARETLADCVGVAIAGSERAGGEKILSYATREGDGTATLFDGGRATPANAALANGTLGEVLSYDDTFESMVIHPSSPVLPAVFAATELVDGDGADLLTGYVAGVEAAYRVGTTTHPAHYEQGWHSTGTIGTFGAAAGAASVLGLTAEQTRHAFGIAGSSSSSLRKNGGSMTFALHAGHAAQTGLRAARLARDGFTADRSVFEGALNYRDVTTPEKSFPAIETPDDDGEWGVMDVGLKAYPCARVPQAAMDGLRDLLQREGLELDDVASVTAAFDPSLEGILDRPNPENWIEARGSIEFCLGAVLVQGDATVDQFADDYVGGAEIRAAMATVTPRYDADLGEAFSKYGARVTVVTEDGEEYVAEVPDAPGSGAAPLSEARQRAKFLDCTVPVLGREDAESLLTRLRSVDDVDDLAVVSDLL